MQISRIRLSDKTSRLHPRHVVPQPAQAHEPEVPVKVREWIGPALASPDLVLEAQPPAQPHGCVVVERPIRFGFPNTDILVASHHGRTKGYCKEVFDYCQPQPVVMSDKSIVHDTQLMAQVYHNEVIKHHPQGVIVATTGKRRHVLTTRRDGHIHFVVDEHARFTITTEHAG
jgi:hypothetical protein